ncbi:MocR-like pyridoxine biosynthesis transcription factor PdxR [Eionea flava]
MTLFSLHNTDQGQAKYLQLADAIRSAIRKGQLVAGDVLPSVNALSRDLALNRHTVMKSLAELIAEGWIESKQRVGYKVVEHLPIEGSRLSKPSVNNVATPIQYRIVRPTTPLTDDGCNEYTYHFSGGRPDVALFPFAEFKSHMSDVLSRPPIHQLGYGETAGNPELIAEVTRYLRKARGITDREVMITNGSQEAIYMVAQLLLQAGDKVAVEALGYPPAMLAFKNAGAQLVSIQQDGQGIVPQDLENKIGQGDIRLIYLTPLHQYPTTVTLTISRRLQIYQLAAKHQIPIIEDDYDHEYHYRCQPLAPMASDDPRQLVIYISTFSKIMFPGTRIGFIAVSKSMAKVIKEYRCLLNHKSNVFMQAALARWMKEGGFERHLRRTTRINQQRRDHAVSFLRSLGVFEFEIPGGGMALWLKIKNHGISTQELAEKAKRDGIYIQYEGQFRHQNNSERRRNKNRYIRIGFAGMDEKQFVKGIKALVVCMNEP